LRVKLSTATFGKEVEELLENAVIFTCSHEGTEDGEISLALLEDSAIQELNLLYLSVNKPTDVIAFALYGPGEPVVGDIYIGYQQAQAQSSDRTIPLEIELVRLAIHGTLHVLGYDHPESNERLTSDMFLLQESLLQDFIENNISNAS
tara:strand:- start:136 stop:579 length:444 start_codon:yes stop_codon:yes gene_type:complete